MKKTFHLFLVTIILITQFSCTPTPPSVCDCASNGVRKSTKEFDAKLQKKCDKHFKSLDAIDQEHWIDEASICLEKDPFYQKLLAEEKRKYFQTTEYLYGTWICVASGIGMRMKMMQGNTYLWQDDLNGFSTGTWQGTNNSLTFYEMGFSTGTGYIDADGKMIHKVAGITLKFTKEN